MTRILRRLGVIGAVFIAGAAYGGLVIGVGPPLRAQAAARISSALHVPDLAVGAPH